MPMLTQSTDHSKSVPSRFQIPMPTDQSKAVPLRDKVAMPTQSTDHSKSVPSRERIPMSTDQSNSVPPRDQVHTLPEWSLRSSDDLDEQVLKQNEKTSSVLLSYK